MSAQAPFRLQPPRPPWGVRAPPRKQASLTRPIVVLPPPRRVQVPVDLGPRCPTTALVAPGDTVLTGQPIAVADSGLAVHASISGTVSRVARLPVAGPEGATALCVEIHGDGEDHWHPDCQPAAASLAPAAIRRHLAAAGIVGLGGALFPAADKLAVSTPVEALILNGAECEPYISCDEILLRRHADTVLRGARLMMQAVGAPRTIIAVESDMPEARVAVYQAIQAAGFTDMEVAVVTAKYPAGGERQLIELLAGREVPAGALPGDVGVICQNVATAAAVADLFTHGRPLVSRIVTVTGGGVARPVNVEARIGTPLTQLLEAAGGLTDPAAQLIMGGPMMGFALPGADLPVTKATNCVIAATPGELSAPVPEFPCIRCGECSEACPARLMPQELLAACRIEDPAALAELHLEACIECGCCDYVCPSHIALTPRFVAGKSMLAALAAQRADAEAARQRAAAHDERVAAAAARAAAEAQRRDAALGTGERGAVSAAALAELLARTGGDAAPDDGDDQR